MIFQSAIHEMRSLNGLLKFPNRMGRNDNSNFLCKVEVLNHSIYNKE